MIRNVLASKNNEYCGKNVKCKMFYIFIILSAFNNNANFKLYYVHVAYTFIINSIVYKAQQKTLFYAFFKLIICIS